MTGRPGLRLVTAAGTLVLAAVAFAPARVRSQEPTREVVGWKLWVREAGLVRIPVNDLPGHAGCAAPGAQPGFDPGLVLTSEGKPVPFYMSDANTLVFHGEPDPTSLDARGRCYHLQPSSGPAAARLGARPTIKAPREDAKVEARSGKAHVFPTAARTYDPLEALDLASLSAVAKPGGYWFYQGDRAKFERGESKGDLELAFDATAVRGTPAVLKLSGIYVEGGARTVLPGGRVRRELGLSGAGEAQELSVRWNNVGTALKSVSVTRGGETTVEIEASWLNPARNSIDVEVAGGRVLAQRAELDYERTAVLEKDESALLLDETLGNTTAIQGLPNGGVVADLTTLDLLEPSFTDAGAVVACPKGHRLLAFVPQRARGLALESCYSNDLRSKDAGADWVAIGPRAILPAIEPLAAHRASQGLKTKLVALEDVEDDFADGAWGAEGLQAFLAFALGDGKSDGTAARSRSPGCWSPRPKFILLAGDALRDARPAEPGAWVPTTLVDTYDNGGSASDRMLLPEHEAGSVAIGRFPVRTLDEAKAVVAKTIAYEKAGPYAGQKQLAFVCGEGRFGPMVDGMIEQLFTQAVSKRVPEAFDVDVTYGNPQSVYLYPPDQFSQRVVERLSQGPLVFDYVGHGAPWALDSVHVPLHKASQKHPNPEEARFPILRCEDAAKVACEPGKNPIVLITACWTGAFDRPDTSVGETLLLNPRGAVAVFAATRVSHPLANALLSLELTQGLFANLQDRDRAKHPRLGERLAAAQDRLSTRSGGEEGKLVMNFAKMMIEEKGLPERVCEDDRRLFNLLGDPALLPNDPVVAPVRAPEKASAGSSATVTLDGKAPLAAVTLERVRGMPAGVEGLPSSVSGKKLLEDPEVRKRVLATYARANDAVVVRGTVDGATGTLALPRDLAPGHYVVKVYAAADQALVGAAPLEVLPPETAAPKKWY